MSDHKNAQNGIGAQGDGVLPSLAYTCRPCRWGAALEKVKWT
jgi:hypothetical protein